MEFACRLGEALGRSLAEVHELSVFELSVWRDYYRRRGFLADRAEWSTALSGCAVANSWGATLKPSDLVPDFAASDPAVRRARFKAWLDSLVPTAGDNGGQ